MLRAVRRHTNQPWVLLYIERWLRAPVQLEDAASCRECRELLREGSLAPSCRICFCIMRSTCGWREPFLTSRSSATRMTPFVTARAPTRRRRYGAHLPTALRPASCAASREDEDRLLQGCEPARRFLEPIVRLPRVQIRVRKALGRGRRAFACFLPAASPKALTFIGRRSGAGRSSSQRQIPARSGRDVQHVHSRLDQLLRQLLSDTVASDPEEDRSLCHPLGAPQIQAVA